MFTGERIARVRPTSPREMCTPPGETPPAGTFKLHTFSPLHSHTLPSYSRINDLNHIPVTMDNRGGYQGQPLHNEILRDTRTLPHAKSFIPSDGRSDASTVRFQGKLISKDVFV